MTDMDERTRREFYFGEQRATNTSRSSLNARWLLSQRQTTEHFDLHPERADSETLPWPPGSPSPAPVIPRRRSETAASREKEKRRSKRSSAGSRSKSQRAAPKEDFDFRSSPPPEVPALLADREYWRTSPTRSQSNITALPAMAKAAQHQTEADKYHRSQPTPTAQRTSKLLTQLYTVSFLVFFAIWGTLARLGLQALTSYPGAPVVFSELWANVAGSFIMGFLSEDMRLFRDEWGSRAGGADVVQPEDEPADGHRDLEKQRRTGHGKVKKTVPLYVGLTTGFCGCFTSFSSFERDVFLGLSNDLKAPTYHPTTEPDALVRRDAGYSVMAVLAVVFSTVALCHAALKMGAHLAVYLDPLTPTLPFRFTRRVTDPLFVVLGLGSWLGAVLMAVFPRHDVWRGQALFACVFAPLGCLARYYVSLLLNAKVPSFPLGTFVCNMFGTAVLGMAYDLQRAAIGSVVGGSVVGCQVLQGIEDGFCGALTTVSTWMLELDTLRRGHAYVYGAGSVVVGLSIITVVMGSVRWSIGWEAVCTI